MKPYKQPESTILVIFGGAGDLTWRKLMPAMYTLYLDKWLGEKFQIISVDAKQMSKEKYFDHLRGGVDQFARNGKTEKKIWNKFASKIEYRSADFNNLTAFRDLCKQLLQYDKEWNTTANKIFYLAIPPAMIKTVAQQ